MGMRAQRRHALKPPHYLIGHTAPVPSTVLR